MYKIKGERQEKRRRIDAIKTKNIYITVKV